MIFLGDETDEEDYKQINRTILDGNLMNMSLIIMEVNYGAIDPDDSTGYGYYIIIYYSYPYILYAEFIIYGQVIYSGGILFEITFFNQYQFSLLYFTKRNPITRLFL